MARIELWTTATARVTLYCTYRVQLIVASPNYGTNVFVTCTLHSIYYKRVLKTLKFTALHAFYIVS